MGGEPYRLMADDVDCIRSLAGVVYPPPPPEPKRFKTGRKVQLLQGPFDGFPATISVDTGISLELTVMIFGRPTPYNVPREWVKAA
jgi:transcription antitermination factor NusG